ncbi:MAG: hypothetical protein MJ094_01370 [Saccharofermentans sp.]|nr:hypothetical protein [Saccharofermentans sp.]
MGKIEGKIVDFLLKKKEILFFVAITVLGAITRFNGRAYVSSDMETYLLPWFYAFKNGGGVIALGEQVGDYGLLYQTVIALMSYSSYNPVYLIKIFSIVFDFALAIAVPYFFCVFTKKKTFGLEFNIIYALLMLLPTYALNSAYWGQCDSVFSFFLFLTLFFLYKGEYKKSFLFYGIAFAFKLQSIFILPFIIAYYFYTKKFSILNSLITVVTFWVSGIVAFFNGRELLAPFTIYAFQTDEHKNMYMTFSSPWMLLGQQYELLKVFALMLAFAVLGIGLLLIISKRKSIDGFEEYLQVAAWFVWTCLMFLPAMHDRYAYYLEIILILLSVLNRRYIKYAAVSIVISTFAYGHSLFATGYISVILVVIYLVTWMAFTFCQVFKNEHAECKV